MSTRRHNNELENFESTENDQVTSPARKNWQRAVSVAIQAGAIDDSESPAPPKPDDYACQREVRREATKTMDLPYFLEMVDGKHRHGSNLRAYHAIWKNAPSNENFFYWLDYGEGRNVEVPQCPRERLERDQVRYLSPEERLKYLVKVDDEGLFRWAKNDELVYTNNKQFKDSMQGVVHVKEGASKFRGNTEKSSSPPSPSSPSASSAIPIENKENSDPHLSTREDYEFGKAVSKFSRIKPTAIYDHFASNISMHDDMWIFVGLREFLFILLNKKPNAIF